MENPIIITQAIKP